MFWQYPLTLQIDPTRKCNLSCKICMRGKSNKYLEKAIRLFEEGERKYQAKELKDALKTGEIEGLLT